MLSSALSLLFCFLFAAGTAMIHIRPAAAQEFKRLLAQQPHNASQSPQISLTLEPGGCAEWTYRLTTNAIPQDASAATLLDCAGIILAVPTERLELIKDLTIDYAEDLMGGGFRFVNPLAQRTCGCGNAFSLNADAPVTQDCTDGLPAG